MPGPLPEQIREAANRLRGVRRMCVITGAGISAESGVPTFRGEGGLWRNYRAEDLATPQAFRRDPHLVWEWYDWRRGICAKAEPNPAHTVVAELENRYAEFLLVTQNVDGLHARAGSRKMAEIHGNIWKARCTRCGTIFETPHTPLAEIPVSCASCGGLARPHILWFGETYDQTLLSSVIEFVSGSDAVIIIGTSGMVPMPVYLAGLARRAFKIDVNPEPSQLSDIADLSLRGKAGVVMPALMAALAGP